jgi:uncharacterized protein YprB with RNaseH-like and TPR domain
MAHNLRSRLQRIREAGKTETRVSPASAVTGVPECDAGPPVLPGWERAGYKALKRSVVLELPRTLPAVLPLGLGIPVPDILRYARDQGMPEPGDLLFFDLETTGLSSGPGTVAFLAAFGRIIKVPGETSFRFKADQYLLLDYPGEAGFLEALLGEFKPWGAEGKPPLVITYNGKSFDSQVLRIRCLMNRLPPPFYYPGDLLHPCRRLWKKLLPSCSQGEIETSILGLDRTGDIPGYMAPDIWFAFLRTGDPSALEGICDHNLKDILGLGAIFNALTRIAGDPAGAEKELRLDTEALALGWRRAIRRYGEGPFGIGSAKTGEMLLAAAADRGCPRAMYALGTDLIAKKQYDEARRHFLDLTGDQYPGEIRAAAYRKLAIDAEWRLKDPEQALGYLNVSLALGETRITVKKELFSRRERLLEKIKHNGEPRLSES